MGNLRWMMIRVLGFASFMFSPGCRTKSTSVSRRRDVRIQRGRKEKRGAPISLVSPFNCFIASNNIVINYVLMSKNIDLVDMYHSNRSRVLVLLHNRGGRFHSIVITGRLSSRWR